MAKFKYKISELAKKASAEDAEKELGIPKSRFEVGQVTISDDGTSKSTITDIDPETGAVKWTITQLPGFDKLYDDLTDLVNTAKRTYVKTKDDKKFRDFYDEIRVIRNKVRTHLRNEYPDQYKRIVRENEVEEISTSGAAGAYNTPYAFVRKPKRKKGKYKYQMKMPSGMVSSLGYTIAEAMDGGQLFDYFAKKGYKVTERSPDGREAGFEGYMVSRGDGPYPQSVIFQYNKDNDRLMISRMGGYRIDQKEAIKAGMRERGYSGVAGRDAYISDGNYKPVNISVEGLKDIVDHVMTGLDREAEAQADFYGARGRTSGTIDEGTCGYDRDKNGKKLKGPGGLGEAIDLVHVYDKDGSIFGTGEIIQKLPNDKVKVRFDGNFMGTFRADRVKPIKEGDTYEKMAAKGKKAGNLKQGTVRKRLGIKKGEKIPLSKINKEISRLKKMDKDKDKAGVQLGDKNQKYYKALQLSKTLKTTTNVDEGSNDPGASLGPGPKAGPDGVTDSAYTKQFKYKLVPKTKDGTYVQKGSGMIVKKLF